VLVGRIRARTEELVRQAAEGQGCAVEVLEVSPDCVHVVLTAPPDRSPQQIVAGLKRESYASLKGEEVVARGPSLWTRQFLASTEPVDEDHQRAFVEAQPSG
jgi:REP element-mobilizing transposase RayT